MAVSVAMAVYTGEKYLEQQVRSIADQLTADDELIVSYNESNDSTKKILDHLAEEYSCIHCVLCEKKGVLSNFEHAVSKCTKEIIFLSDQDDLWMKDKVQTVLEAMRKSNAVVAMHDCIYTDSDLNETGNTLFQDRNVRTGYWKNLIRNGYQGSCMAFRKELCDVILPFPEDIAMHDQWIGMLGEKCGNTVLIDQVLMKYRRHEDVSSTDHVPYMKKLIWMKNLMCEIRIRTRDKNEVITQMRQRWSVK